MTRKINSNLGSHRCSGTVSTVSTQGEGVASLLDWNPVADGLLWLLNGGGCHDKAFADDFTVVTVSSELNAAVNFMQYMIREVTSWCLETGLKVNPDKTELVMFKRRHKLPPFTPPSLAGKRLEAKNSAKYLGVILDSKLNWNEHLDETIRKFHVAFWLCRGTFGGGWG